MKKIALLGLLLSALSFGNVFAAGTGETVEGCPSGCDCGDQSARSAPESDLGGDQVPSQTNGTGTEDV